MNKPNNVQLALIKQAVSDAVKVALDSLGDGWKNLSFVSDAGEKADSENKKAA